MGDTGKAGTKTGSKAKPKQRIRSPHSGVVLLKPEGARVAWRVRYLDPDRGKVVKERVDPVKYRSAEARAQYATKISRRIAKRRDELKAGAVRLDRTPIKRAVKDYLDARAVELRPRTRELYAGHAAAFLAWAEGAGIESPADLNRLTLSQFRDHVLTRGRQRANSRSESGEMTDPRSPASINSELATHSAMVNHWRRRGLVPVDSDAIADCLKGVRAPSEPGPYLRPDECQRLLDAAIAYDAARAKGVLPVAPYLALLLTSGMRASTALKLRRSRLDLDALNVQGQPVGVIALRASDVKDRKAREVDLAVSPGLRDLLRALDETRPDGAEYVLWDGEPPVTIYHARRALVQHHGAPPFDLQQLRRTCGTYLANAPAIFGAASIHLSARQLGHSVRIAEKNYLGHVRGLSPDARTLDDVLGIGPQLAAITAAVSAGRAVLRAV